MKQGVNTGIDVLIGIPLTEKSVPNVSSMPKFYALINTKLYNSTETKNKTTYTLPSAIDMYAITSGYQQLPSWTYSSNDTFDKEQQFTQTRTPQPKFDVSSSYDNKRFTYQTKE